MKLELAHDIKSEISRIVLGLGLTYVKVESIICFRSFGSTSRAIARIWSLPRIWQLALSLQPSYCVEVISEKYDRLSETDKEKILIHELMHVPKNFSGSLLSHNHNGRRINRKMIDELFSQLCKNSK